ncbi:MAG: hypothetical protein ABL903_17630 [Methylococcales bacterium]
MNEDLDDLLGQRYPKLFKNRHGDKMSSFMGWGFGCGDGWFAILDTAAALITADSPEAYALQVKEKFGGLRFYLSGHSEFGAGVVEMAEALSYLMCETCGRPAICSNKCTGHTASPRL